MELLNDKPLQPAIRGRATIYYSEGRKRCQHSLLRAKSHKGQSSYTSFRINGKGLFTMNLVHNADTIMSSGCFQCPETDREFTGDCYNCFFTAPGVTRYTSVFVQQHRVFSDRPPCALDQPRSHICGALTSDSAPANRIARRILPAGETGERRDVLACSEAEHIAPLKCQPDRCEPTDARRARFHSYPGLVTFFITQSAEFVAKYLLDGKGLLQLTKVHIKTNLQRVWQIEIGEGTVILVIPRSGLQFPVQTVIIQKSPDTVFRRNDVLLYLAQRSADLAVFPRSLSGTQHLA